MGLLIKLFTITVAILLAFHGLFHLTATALYLNLGNTVNPAYKTTLLAGQWDVGTVGIAIFAVLWAFAALAFIVAAALFAFNQPYWKVMLLTTTLFSLALIILDWQVSYLGAIVNTIILIFLAISHKVFDAYRLPKANKQE